MIAPSRFWVRVRKKYHGPISTTKGLTVASKSVERGSGLGKRSIETPEMRPKVMVPQLPGAHKALVSKLMGWMRLFFPAESALTLARMRFEDVWRRD